MGYSEPVVRRLGARDYLITFGGADLEDVNEVEIPGLPPKGRVRRIKSNLDSFGVGDAVTLDPILGTTTDPSGLAVVAENGTPAVSPELVRAGDYPYYSEDGILFYRGRPNAGSDGEESVEILLSSGWAP